MIGFLLRGCVAWGVIATGGRVPLWCGGIGLVLCVWMDAASGWLARRRAWVKSPLAVHVECMADFLCFVWAPCAWVTASCQAVPVWIGAGLFVMAGIFRLARFQVEGLVGGGYRGLPVTYNGYLIPLTALLVGTALPHPAWVWPAAFVALALLMVSTRFTTPEL